MPTFCRVLPVARVRFQLDFTGGRSVRADATLFIMCASRNDRRWVNLGSTSRPVTILYSEPKSRPGRTFLVVKKNNGLRRPRQNGADYACEAGKRNEGCPMQRHCLRGTRGRGTLLRRPLNTHDDGHQGSAFLPRCRAGAGGGGARVPARDRARQRRSRRRAGRGERLRQTDRADHRGRASQ